MADASSLEQPGPEAADTSEPAPEVGEKASGAPEPAAVAPHTGDEAPEPAADAPAADASKATNGEPNAPEESPEAGVEAPESGGDVGSAAVSDPEDAAAVKMQAVQRGRMARKGKEEISGNGPPDSPKGGEPPSGAEPEDAAAVKMQAVQRGRMARKKEIGGGPPDSPEGDDRIQLLLASLQDLAVRVIELLRDWDEDANGMTDRREFRLALPVLGLFTDIEETDALFDTIAGNGTDSNGEDHHPEGLRTPPTTSTCPCPSRPSSSSASSRGVPLPQSWSSR